MWFEILNNLRLLFFYYILKSTITIWYFSLEFKLLQVSSTLKTYPLYSTLLPNFNLFSLIVKCNAIHILTLFLLCLPGLLQSNPLQSGVNVSCSIETAFYVSAFSSVGRSNISTYFARFSWVLNKYVKSLEQCIVHSVEWSVGTWLSLTFLSSSVSSLRFLLLNQMLNLVAKFQFLPDIPVLTMFSFFRPHLPQFP